MEGWNTENGRWDQRWDDLAVGFSINDTDSDGDGYQRTVNGDDECEKFDRGTVREIYQDISLCSQQADVVCLQKKVENLGEIPRKTLRRQ